MGQGKGRGGGVPPYQPTYDTQFTDWGDEGQHTYTSQGGGYANPGWGYSGWGMPASDGGVQTAEGVGLSLQQKIVLPALPAGEKFPQWDFDTQTIIGAAFKDGDPEVYVKRAIDAPTAAAIIAAATAETTKLTKEETTVDKALIKAANEILKPASDSAVIKIKAAVMTAADNKPFAKGLGLVYLHAIRKH